MKKKLEKLIALRLTNEEYEKCLDIALKESEKNKKVVSVSEIIRKFINKEI